MCTCSPENNSYSGLRNRKRDQQLGGDGFPLLLSSHEALPALWCPALKPPK